jgi:hypothetical protein
MKAKLFPVVMIPLLVLVSALGTPFRFKVSKITHM